MLSERLLREMNTALFVFVNTNSVMLCYVDHVIRFATDQYSVDSLLRKFGTTFQVKDLWESKRFLELYLIFGNYDFILLSQNQLINEVSDDTSMARSRPVESLINEDTLAAEAKADQLETYIQQMCRSILGSLMYIYK